MTTVLIVEDDDAIRTGIVRLLEREGYETRTAGDGRAGLQELARWRPDLVVSDISMPEMDGFELVRAVRADPSLAATPVLLLTALGDRGSSRQGMTAGADDYLPKPFSPAELQAALQGLLRKRARIENSIASAVKQRTGAFPPVEAGPDREVDAAVLFADIRNFTALAEKLSSSEAAELLAAYFERICAPVLGNGGRHLKLIGDGLMSVFIDDRHRDDGSPAARRCVQAALAMVRAAEEFAGWIDQRFGERELPPFAIGIGLHGGEVTLARLGAGEHREITAIGDTVNVAARLEAASKDLGWNVVASATLLRRAGPDVLAGRPVALDVRGRNDTVAVSEVIGLAVSGDAGAQTRWGAGTGLQV